MEKEMVTHCSVLAQRTSWTGAWRTKVHGVAKTGALISLIFCLQHFGNAQWDVPGEKATQESENLCPA